MRIASNPEERLTEKQQHGIQVLASRQKTNRKVGRPKKRLEDYINQFVKPDETEETRGSDLKNNDTWLKAAKDQQRWKDMEKDYKKNS